ncbi:Zinc finger protein HD1 [Ananas comosus]|uniref:Zinc finger protein HD1 n=1 Tax=Ananas comosus TaxID=4615 RepID=A0A199VX26_ANACO|nr:Zinc finger protein HD1 [Ananas comosus]
MNGLQVSAAESYNINGHEGGGIGGRVGRYSAEERKERIEKYRSKRNQRNFHKKITYACRKTLADSRPRVRGRFARNGEPETETEVEIETEAAENGYYENFDYNVCNNYDQTQNSGGGGSEKTLADSWPRVRGRLARNVEAEMEVETEAAENGYCEDFGYNIHSSYNQTQNGGGGNDSNTQWGPQTSALTDEEEDRCYVGDELWVEFGDVFSVNFLS